MKKSKRKPTQRPDWAPGRRDKVSRSYRLYTEDRRRASESADTGFEPLPSQLDCQP